MIGIVNDKPHYTFSDAVRLVQEKQSKTNENWEVVQRNKETGEEKTFANYPWHTSKETAEKAAELRRMIISDRYEVFIRKTELKT